MMKEEEGLDQAQDTKSSQAYESDISTLVRRMTCGLLASTKPETIYI
jgi:hypothetical protein